MCTNRQMVKNTEATKALKAAAAAKDKKLRETLDKQLRERELERHARRQHVLKEREDQGEKPRMHAACACRVSPTTARTHWQLYGRVGLAVTCGHDQSATYAKRRIDAHGTRPLSGSATGGCSWRWLKTVSGPGACLRHG